MSVSNTVPRFISARDMIIPKFYQPTVLRFSDFSFDTGVLSPRLYEVIKFTSTGYVEFYTPITQFGFKFRIFWAIESATTGGNANFIIESAPLDPGSVLDWPAGNSFSLSSAASASMTMLATGFYQIMPKSFYGLTVYNTYQLFGFKLVVTNPLPTANEVYLIGAEFS